MLNNKYATWYFNIILNAKSIERDCYTEKHHIIPRSLGGDNTRENLVRLSPREHFICHRLLTRMVEGLERKKMLWAMHKMMYTKNAHQTQRHIPNARTFERFREEFASMLRKPRVITEEHRQKIIEANKRKRGTKLSDETKKRMSDSHQGRKLSDEHKEKISKAHAGKPKSEEHRNNVSEGLKRWYQAQKL